MQPEDNDQERSLPHGLPSGVPASAGDPGGVTLDPETERLLDSCGIDRDAAARLLPGMPEGCWPLRSGSAILMVGRLDSGERPVFACRPASGEDLELHLRRMHGDDPVMLVDSDGRIHFPGATLTDLLGASRGEMSDISDIFPSAGVASITSSMREFRQSGQVLPFTVETLSSRGRLSLVASTRLSPGNTDLFELKLSTPTIGMSDVCPVETSLVDTIFNSIPLPAMTITSEGSIRRVNEAFATLTASRGIPSPVGTHFSGWIAEDEREGVASIHSQRISGGMAPFRYIVRTSTLGGTEMTFEVTALLLPDGSETMIFMLPVDPAEAGAASTGTAGELSAMLPGVPESQDPARSILEFIRIGTGASGVALSTSGGLHTAGEIPSGRDGTPESRAAQDREPEVWTRTADDLYTLRRILRLRGGLARIEIFGLRSDAPSGLAALVLSLVPVLVDYCETVQAQKHIMQTFSAILETWDYLRMGDAGPERFLARAAEVTGSDAIVIWGPPGPEGSLQVVASHGLPVEGEPLNLGVETSAGWAYTHSEPVYVADSVSDGRFSAAVQGFRSEVVIPLQKRHGRASGVLLAASRSPGAFPNPTPGLFRLLSIPLSFWLFPEKGGGEPDSRTKAEGDRNLDLEDVFLSLSHKLLAPGNAVRGFCDLLSTGRLGPLTPEQEEVVSSLSRSAATMSGQTERLVSLLRLEIQPDRMESSWGRPLEVIEALVPEFAARAAADGLQFTLDAPTGSFTACFDRTRLEEVFRNLADNALRYNRKGGSVTAVVRLEKTSWILEVEDTGRGIPSRALPFIFDRFYRGQDDEGAGLGIGLSIVRRFAELMGGTVNVFSREGSGSRFTLRLPVSGRAE